MGSKLVLALDIGGTQSRVALIDGEAQIIKRMSVPTEEGEGYKKVIKAIRDFFSGPELDAVAGIGVAIAGLLKSDSGVLLSSPNMRGWLNVPIKRIFADEFGVPVYAGNDATMAAVGEHRYGAAKGLDNFLYITVSTGIGGGLILNGKPFTGADGFAGEVGHMTINPGGPVCSCGRRGCFEVMASGTAIARDAKERIASGAASIIGDMVDREPEKITAQVVEQAARQGDELAKDVMHQAAVNLGIGLSNLIMIFDPQAIIVGGGVTNSNELIFEPAREVVAQRAGCYFEKDVPILKAALGDNVGLIGAAALALDSV